MSVLQVVQWSLWGVGVLAGLVAIASLGKLFTAQRFLPAWEELKQIDPTLALRREELRRTTETIDTERRELAQLDAEVGHLKLLKEWQAQNPDAPARIQQMLADLEHSRAELTAVQQDLAKHEERRDEAQRAVNALTSERQDLLGQTESLRGRVSDLRKEEAGLAKTVKELEGRSRQLEPLVTSLEAQVRDKQEQLTRAEAQYEQTTQARIEVQREINALVRDRHLLADQAASLRSEVAGLAKEKSEREKAVRQLEDRLQRLEPQVAALEVQLKDWGSKLEKAQAQWEQATRARSLAERERDEARAARDAAKAEMEGLQKSIEALKAIAAGVSEQLRSSGVSGDARYDDLFRPIPFPKLGVDRRKQDERDVLAQAKDYIRSKGLAFPDRVLCAFHASLKTGMISPLTVLAGISGTGKSELPRHYADGMGMQFMLVAVQPRWDSPQDLFGFYNYLEKRYKATELARALVQFELYNRDAWTVPEGGELADRRDQVLLVLLDEMNLARTEYYFSEFLSKLETRRTINEGDPSDRARAEIELDMGSLGEGQASIRLYPGRNVLFVGTMNEDESTQALTDKVIDRATVLRFWRPRSTKPVDGHASVGRPTTGLTFKTWQQWQQDDTKLDPHGAQVDEWIQGLNQALTPLGRPFAYRVDKAIRSYVANYPRWVPDWHKRAMADQIEQRIFPRLRGIEPDHVHAQAALSTIGRLIDQLGDEPLRRAFRESTESDTFIFRGVERGEDD